ncbi:endonuclease/exonuclease/phosphatase family protein [Vibrio sp. SCSIO 43136]|uniref:endonuclease/exonuclease/phosphatase family protein n=1 Tax=Vibrio sp. SCSIO 43136 TaxID=2819101 RepID=UPI002075A056|nr:endonuclease/exonuclease/phosphatase family protein [Vibrio sp. SCSIO 43136]USD66938.1 endonuclease/exonuclease/phosphatase family protein [Vibrio sp. SCSIO 43136]
MIKVATLNLCNFAQPPFASYEWDNILTAEQWESKCEWLRAQLKQVSPDIIAFQEVFSIPALKAVCAQLGYNHFCCPGSPKVEHEYVFSEPCVAVASKYPLRTIKLSDKIRSQFARYPAIARITLPNRQKVTVISVHLKSQRASAAPDRYSEQQSQLYGQWVSSFQRAQEATELHKIVKKQSSKTPTIVMGDFNQSLDSESLKPMTDSILVADCRKATGASEVATFYHRFSPITIDHIMVTHDLEVCDYQCIDNHLPSNGLTSSDHAIVSATLDQRCSI